MKKTLEDKFFKFLSWREENIKEPVFISFLSFIVGISCALVAALLKGAIHLIQDFVTNRLVFDGLDLGFLIFPVIGVLLAGLFVRYIVKDDISHGVTKILYALSQRKSRIKPHNMWTSLVASSVTIGMGGSVGAEAPIVLTGSAIGSNIGRLFRLDQRNLMLLVGCGAAGAVSGIFKAPITGLIFVIEVLMLDLTLTSVLPLLISSVTGATMAYFLFGTDAMFSFSMSDTFELDRIPFVLLLGICCGLASLYFTKISFSLEKKLRGIKLYRRRYLISALILSVLIFILPSLYGEGYQTISSLIDGDPQDIMVGSFFSLLGDKIWVLPLFVLLSLLFKVFATVATNSGGGSGGVFAPSLFVGALVGFFFSHIIDLLSGVEAVSFIFPHLSTKNFALMGMAGVMAGVMHAPLTGTFLIAELTGSYSLFLPLLLVSISSYATIKVFLPHSIYSLRLAEKGKLLTHHKDKAVLTLMQVDNVIEQNFSRLHPSMTLGDVVRVFSESQRNVFPVVGDDGKIMGIVMLDNIRNIMFRSELYGRFKVSQFMITPPAKVVSDMNMEEVMDLFDDVNAWNLPVVDTEGKYLGFVSKSRIFNTYRDVLINNFNGD
ncbi:chloride channel protein [Porphyromonas cangingivalis]|uniref:Chloride channel protein n=1 Tax=Porphyromonas cangingivalis TaxID=36874 RepID=A0A0A2ERS0_PORCN|nr:chloride channel protein [Porphyromonas cangingivalis]KGN81561.1 chloride channel protein [Porphyromonas cangingivalis]